MPVLFFLLLTILAVACGAGIIRICNIQLRPGVLIPLALLTGIALFSCVPFFLQLFFIQLTRLSIFLTLFVCGILLNMPLKKTVLWYKNIFRDSRVSVRLYEIPFLLLTTVIVIVSVWRCFYFPPTPRDLTSGAEAIAEYAVKEHTMINSVFTVNMESTNNPFKPPFVTSLQVIYKLAGFHFGKVWLSIIFVSFIIFLYHALNDTLHPVISGFLLICFIAIPEMFAYTFMVLFDYSNAVYFFIALYFLIVYFKNNRYSYLVFAAVMMGVATYTRNETLILSAFILPAVVYHAVKNKWSVIKMIVRAFTFLLPSLIFYILCVPVYLNHYLPVTYNVNDQLNQHLLNLSPLFVRFKEMNLQLVFSKEGIVHYSYFIFIFTLFLLGDLVLKGRFNSSAKNWLFFILVAYMGLPILGYLLPLVDLDNTTKRGLFKLFPLMLLYLANSPMLVNLTQRIMNWERKQ